MAPMTTAVCVSKETGQDRGAKFLFQPATRDVRGFCVRD